VKCFRSFLIRSLRYLNGGTLSPVPTEAGQSIQTITGKAETFVVETARHEELGDYVFVECVDEAGVIRLCLPPRVANAIASQRDSLTSRRRSIASKAVAKMRMERGEIPGFMKKK
jgi:hypothetical protein